MCLIMHKKTLNKTHQRYKVYIVYDNIELCEHSQPRINKEVQNPFRPVITFQLI